MYILKLNILVPMSEDLNLESEIAIKLEEILKNSDAVFVSTMSEEVVGENYGKCSECGCWVSNQGELDFINIFSNGIKIDNRWYCDICLPEDHPYAF